MLIIEIECLYNGAHRNQTSSSVIPVPDGWAVIFDSITTFLNNFISKEWIIWPLKKILQ